MPVSQSDLFHKLKNLGIRILLDDFGTGYASLSCLKKFPTNGFKIDKSIRVPAAC